MKKVLFLIIAVVMGLSAIAQKNYDSKRVGLYFGFNWNGSLYDVPKQDSKFGSFSIGEIGFDCRLYRHEKVGISHNLMLTFGADRTVFKRMKKADFGTYPLNDDVHMNNLFKDYVTSYNGSLGYMISIQMGKVGEFQPFIRFGYDFYDFKGNLKAAHLKRMAQIEEYTIKDDINDDNATRNHAYYMEPGCRVAFNVLYPVQLYVQVVYSKVIKATDTYTILNNYTRNFGYGHEKGLGVGGGIRICF